MTIVKPSLTKTYINAITLEGQTKEETLLKAQQLFYDKDGVVNIEWGFFLHNAAIFVTFELPHKFETAKLKLKLNRKYNYTRWLTPNSPS